MRIVRVGSLVGVLVFHVFGALTWFAALGFSADHAGSERQFFAGLAFGAATWLAMTFVIVWQWRSKRPIWWAPIAWWFPSYLLMVTVVYGWDDQGAISLGVPIMRT